MSLMPTTSVTPVPPHSVRRDRRHPTSFIPEEMRDPFQISAREPAQMFRNAVRAVIFLNRLSFESGHQTHFQERLELGSLENFILRDKLPKDVLRADSAHNSLNSLYGSLEEKPPGSPRQFRLGTAGARSVKTPMSDLASMAPHLLGDGADEPSPAPPKLVVLEVPQESQRPSKQSAPPVLKPSPPKHPRAGGGSRRPMVRDGDKVCLIRNASPRHQQLRELLPQMPGSPPPLSPVRMESMPSARSTARSPFRGKEPPSAFSLAFVGTTGAKSRTERHPLLHAIRQGDQDLGGHGELHGEHEQASLAQRLGELRGGDPRRGGWAPAEKRPPAPGATSEGALPHSAQHALEAGNALSSSNQGVGFSKGLGPVSEDWKRMIHMMDHENTGFVSPDVFVPLMFWLGLTRRRSAALLTIDLAFGPGPVPGDTLRELSYYEEVQVRLVDGFRKLARRESLEHLCEFLTDSDSLRMRTWFHSMKRDPAGHVDIVEIQNLFAREGVTSDRQTLFRFLNYLARSPILCSEPDGGREVGAKRRNLALEDFQRLVCRAIVAWCIYRSIALVNSTTVSGAIKDDSQPAAAAASLGSPSGSPRRKREEAADAHDVELRWTQLQRKIIVSLLINHRFWGKESRHVLTALKPPATTTMNDELSPEQWLSLFQRVRAQGMAAILPTGEEADDPGFLQRKTQHDDIAKEPRRAGRRRHKGRSRLTDFY